MTRPPPTAKKGPAWSKSQSRATAAIIASPTVHLCECVSWSDDNGDQWAGSIAQAAMDPDDAVNCIVPEPNTLQLRIERAIAYAEARGQQARIIILKGRRSGSSLICAKIADLECRKRKIKALCMGDQYSRSDEIFEMVSQFSRSDVVPWGFGVKVSDTTISYGNGSKLKKKTALDVNAGRGSGNRFLWFSECAFYPSDGVRDAAKLMTSALLTLSKKPGAIVIAESTANGADGWFHETWLGAEWPEDEDYFEKWQEREPPKQDALWLRVFAAWFEIPRNAMPVDGELERKVIMSRLSDSEAIGVARYGWTAEQLKWRRSVIKNDLKGDERMFDQEFPHSPESAFLTTGRNAFRADALATLRTAAERAKDRWQYGRLKFGGFNSRNENISRADILNGDTAQMTVRFERTTKEEAWVKIIEHPADGLSYLLTVDPASEKELAGGENGELDRMSVLMLRAGYDEMRTIDGRQERVSIKPRLAARILWEVMDDHPDGDDTTLMLSLLNHYYGRPTTVVEVNKGEWVIMLLKRARVPMYRTRTGDRDRRKKKKEQLGFVTGPESRATVIKELQNLLHGHESEDADTGDVYKEPGMDIEDMHVVEELEHFVLLKGKYQAASGHHDDDVLNLAIGNHLLASATTYRAPVRRRR